MKKRQPRLLAGRKRQTPYPLPASNLEVVTIVMGSGRRPGSCFVFVWATNKNARIFQCRLTGAVRRIGFNCRLGGCRLGGHSPATNELLNALSC